MFIMTNDKNFVIIDKGSYFILFENPVFEIEVQNQGKVIEGLKNIEEIVKEKFYIAGFICYEAGYEIVGLPVKQEKNNIPLLWFGVFTKPKILEIPKEIEHNFSISNIRSSLSYDEYIGTITKIKNYIRDGYTYQANFTFKIFFEFEGDPISLFLDLRRKQLTKYTRFVKYKDTYILSLSPELFFKISDNTIVTKPMKGTIRRGRFLEEDKKLSEMLFKSEKDRAENLMIIDLLRNDLGIVSEFGSVKVEKMFEIEKYQTVFQMTSTIVGRIDRSKKFSDIIKSIFPGGSITGAPKKKTMEILKELEKYPRGIYTGTIGYILPNGNSEFNIAIRTPVIQHNKGEIGVGSGITWYSEEQKEYKECLLKSSFLISKPYKEFYLIETMLLKNNKIYLLRYHLKRLTNSAKYFSFKYSKKAIMEKLIETMKIEGKHKVRLLLKNDGNFSIEIHKLDPKPKNKTIKIAEDRVNSKDIFLYHKTTNREIYNIYSEKTKEENVLDYVFLNEKGYVTEGTKHNIIILIEGNLITPKRTSGVLRGTMLEYLSKKYNIKEGNITLEDLKNSKSIFLCNSVSGIKKVKLIL
ncbi:MAG: aminodeoxychorismate synthase component I [Brevinematia bacterium]